MRNIWTIARREYRHYFSGPIAYIIALGILFVVGAYFFLYLYILTSQYGTTPPDANIIVGPMSIIFLLGIPAMTMRLLADEQRMGTLELLLTTPIREVELVVGKWLGAFLFALTVIASTLVYVVVLNALVTPGIDWGIVFGCYLGIILMVASLLALGTAISSLFSNQFAAFFVTFIVVLILWWVVGWPASVFQYGTVHDIFAYLDINGHFNTMTTGVIPLSGIIYYLSLTTLGLFVGTAVVEIRRWQ